MFQLPYPKCVCRIGAKNHAHRDDVPPRDQVGCVTGFGLESVMPVRIVPAAAAEDLLGGQREQESILFASRRERQQLYPPEGMFKRCRRERGVHSTFGSSAPARNSMAICGARGFETAVSTEGAVHIESTARCADSGRRL